LPAPDITPRPLTTPASTPTPLPSEAASSARAHRGLRPAATSARTSRMAEFSSSVPYSKLRCEYEKPSRSRSRWSALRRPIVVFPALAIGLIVALLVHRSSQDRNSPFSTPISSRLHDSLDRSDWGSHKHGPTTGGEFDCNPFATGGRLHVDVAVPTNNVWNPFDSNCKPSNYLASIYRSEGDSSPLIPLASSASSASSSSRQFLPWLMNRTIVIHGDSIDRFHLKDFCAFVQGRLTLITPDHPASPPPYHQPLTEKDSTENRNTRQEKERFWEGRPREAIELTNPWVCDIEEYGATIVNVFTWGLQGAEEFFQTERWYYPPGEPTICPLGRRSGS
jgi:hypothetical protein